MTDTSGVWGSIQRWRSVAFFIAGVGFLLIAINFGAREAANTGVAVSPIVPIAFMALVYVGLLGLSPGLVARAPRLGRVSQALVVIFGLDILLNLGVGIDPGAFPLPILELLVVSVMLGSALTVTVFGAVSLWTGAYSRAVGGFLLLAALGLYGGIAANILFGTISPAWVSAAYNGLFGISLVAVGYALRTKSPPTEQRESTETAI